MGQPISEKRKKKKKERENKRTKQEVGKYIFSVKKIAPYIFLEPFLIMSWKKKRNRSFAFTLF